MLLTSEQVIALPFLQTPETK